MKYESVDDCTKFVHECIFDDLSKDFEIRHKSEQDCAKQSFCFCFDSSWMNINRLIVNAILLTAAKELHLEKLGNTKNRETDFLPAEALFGEVMSNVIGPKSIDDLIKDLQYQKERECKVEREFNNQYDETRIL